MNESTKLGIMIAVIVKNTREKTLFDFNLEMITCRVWERLKYEHVIIDQRVQEIPSPRQDVGFESLVVRLVDLQRVDVTNGKRYDMMTLKSIQTERKRKQTFSLMSVATFFDLLRFHSRFRLVWMGSYTFHIT